MKIVLGTMVGFYLLMTVGGLLWLPIFDVFGSMSPEATYLLPIYGGLLSLSGLIAFCTIRILRALKEIKTMLEK